MFLQKLLSQGYFHQEIPPSFTTTDFAAIVSSASLSEGFLRNSYCSELCKHEIPHIGINRRTVGIPNPVAYYRLSKEIEDSWDEIEKHLAKSNLSLSKPILNEEGVGRAIHREHHNEHLLKKYEIRSKSKYILVTDISRFYPSVYTHSISWALHEKKVIKSKEKKDDLTLLGNRLDTLVRNAQDKQTAGIPVGPDTSVILSEILLVEFDYLLEKELGEVNGFRYVDDFELGFTSYHEAEQALATIRSLLNHFELEVNSQKTKILELPLAVNNSWLSHLRQFDFYSDKNPARQNLDLQGFMDLALEYSKLYPNDHVLRYAIKKIAETHDIADKNKILFEQFLFQCLMIEPSTFQLAIATLYRMYIADKFDADLDTLHKVMNHQILSKCKNNHGNEVAWALWALIYWELNLDSQAEKTLSEYLDPIVMTLALDAKHRKVISRSFDTTSWKTILEMDDILKSEYWLFAYEANRNNWIKTSTDYVEQDPDFKFLKKQGVQFYDFDQNIDLKMLGFDDNDYPDYEDEIDIDEAQPF